MNQAIRRFVERIGEPSEKAAYDTWVTLDDATELLREDLGRDDIALYCSVGDIFLHGVLTPSDAVTPPDAADLMKWTENPYSSWGKVYSFDPPKVWIEPPLAGSSSKTIAKAEQLVFVRTFDGVSDSASIELLQKLAHLFGLHYVEERLAYCTLDKRGDLEDIVSIVRIDHIPGRLSGGTIVTIRRSVIDEYMAITGTTMVRMFDITRFNPRAFGGWAQGHDGVLTADGDLIYRKHVEPGYASYMRGVQVISSQLSKEVAAERHGLGEEPDRKYESFLAVDWKNGKIREISTEPGNTANYFTKSELPFEVSPAFFRPEVLLRYKSDSDKYTLQDRSISCRGAWHLQTYDINDAGQVHTYIVYLRSLPYEEQLYWKAHNEAPKASISKRAFRSDFEGRWEREYDALQNVREEVRRLNEKAPPWWLRRSERMLDGVHYPVTTSFDEWANEILALQQLVIEGLKDKALRARAVELGRTPGSQLGSLKLVEECLIGLGWEEERAREVTAPLHHLHDYRSKVKAHSRGQEAERLRKALLREHRTFANHFRALTAECDEALRTIEVTLSGVVA